LPPHVAGPSSVDQPSDPLTTPGRRLDLPGKDSPLSTSRPSERLVRTDENPPLDFAEETVVGLRPSFTTDSRLPSAAEEEDVIVVDDIAEQVDEDEVAPHTEQEENASASTVPPPHSRH
jgi:hypothetical protein